MSCGRCIDKLHLNRISYMSVSQLADLVVASLFEGKNPRVFSSETSRALLLAQRDPRPQARSPFGRTLRATTTLTRPQRSPGLTKDRRAQGLAQGIGPGRDEIER